MLTRYADLGDDPQDLIADICIVGAGVAGLALAARLTGRGLRILLLEAGGTDQTPQSQSFYAGEVADPAVHWPLDTYRVRALGGTGRIWGGRVIPYDPIDFAARPWVPCSGWPFGPETLAPYYPAALAAAEGGAFDYTPSGPLVPGLDNHLVTTTVERFSRPTDFWVRYGPFLTDSDARVVIEAAVTGIALSPAADRVDHLIVRGASGTGKARAAHYVLAMGGLETARLLMASNDVLPTGIGNAGGWLGKGYMCHLAATFGEVQFTGSPRAIGFDYQRDADGIYLRRRLALTETAQHELEVLNFTARLHIPDANDPAHRDPVLSLIFLAAFAVKYEYSRAMREADRSWSVMARHLANIVRDPWRVFHFARTWGVQRYFASRRIPSIALYSGQGRYPLEFHAEQAPNAQSRVTLTDARDAYGMPRLKVDWQVTPLDFATVRKAYRLIAQQLEQTGTGRLTFDEAGLEAAVLKAGAYGGHHSGTARMAASPEHGVVDADCRVHGMANLFVASSAVLPTSSQANPTLTIVALALRLADHLQDRPAFRPHTVAGHRVLVTGAAGFAGRAIAQRLAAAGFVVRAGTRSGSAVPGAAEVVVCDVLDRASIAVAMRGATAVVHCAVGPPGDTRVITEGTRNVLDAARAQGDVHVLHLSSVAVYGATRGVIDETATTGTAQGGYGVAKRSAEAMCRAAVAAGLPVTVLRPALIWGKGSKAWTELYIERLASGNWHALGDAGLGWANLIHVEDLARFVGHLIARGPPRAEAIYNVNASAPPTWNAYLEALQSRLGLPAQRPPRRFAMLALGLRVLIGVCDRLIIKRVWRRRPPARWLAVRTMARSIPSRDETRRFGARVFYDNARMLQSGYVPEYDLARGIAEIAGESLEPPVPSTTASKRRALDAA
jgi:nucleoside-diphosphate-sugar epimerase/choline dehydrogenase-like flavoprotein